MIEVAEHERRWVVDLLPELYFASTSWLACIRSWGPPKGVPAQTMRHTRAVARELGSWLDRHPSPPRLRPVAAELREAVQEVHSATTLQLRAGNENSALLGDGCVLIARAARRLASAQNQLLKVLE